MNRLQRELDRHTWHDPRAFVNREMLSLGIVTMGLFLASVVIDLSLLDRIPSIIHVAVLIPQMAVFVALLSAIFLIPFRSVEITIGFLLVSLSNIGSYVFNFAYAYTGLGLIGPDGERISDLLTSIYFSAITWTTVGYGDIRPAAEARGVAAFEAIAGVVFMSLFISGFVACLTKRD